MRSYRINKCHRSPRYSRIIFPILARIFRGIRGIAAIPSLVQTSGLTLHYSRHHSPTSSSCVPPAPAYSRCSKTCFRPARVSSCTEMLWRLPSPSAVSQWLHRFYTSSVSSAPSPVSWLRWPPVGLIWTMQSSACVWTTIWRSVLSTTSRRPPPTSRS